MEGDPGDQPVPDVPSSPSSEPAPVIRRYTPQDREAVRRICVATADGGHPLDVGFFPDVELFADLLTSYFTDYQPEGVWIADTQGEVVGYVSGCFSTLAMQRITMLRIFPSSMWRALRRGSLLRLAFLRTIWNNARVWFDSVLQRQSHVLGYPAQLHINLKPGFRGRHVGRALVEKFLGQLRERGLRGVEASVREDNLPARRFFERLGFVALARHPLLIRRGRMLSSVVYGKSLS